MAPCSRVALPLSAGGPMLGVLSFGSVRSPRAWPAELVERLRLLSEAFARTLERKRVELSLAERLRFEKLLSSLSTTFSHLSAGDFNREVQHALHRVVDFLGVARGSLIEFSRDGGTAHSWAIEEWMDVGEFPWMTARLQHGDVVSFSELETLPDEAAVDRQSYLAHRVKPQVAMPLMAGGTEVGGLVFSTGEAERPQSDELGLMQQLHLPGEVFANALSRKQGELETQRLRQEPTHIGRVSAMGELTPALAPDLRTVLGDRVQLQQVVLNLVQNGLEALRPPAAGPRALVIRTALDGTATVTVSVQDSGTGIDEKDMERIFEPLYTTKADGLGMGLAIVRTIVGAHGGRLGAANNEHSGATFHFTLPVREKDEC